MAWTTIRTAAALDLPAFAEPLEIHHDPEQHALLALDPATGESEVLTTRLPDLPLLPDEAVVKDWSEHSGLARALAEAGVVELLDFLRQRRDYADGQAPHSVVAWGSVLGVVAGGLVGWFVPMGIASINAMVVAVVCYLLGDLLLGRRAPERLAS